MSTFAVHLARRLLFGLCTSFSFFHCLRISQCWIGSETWQVSHGCYRKDISRSPREPPPVMHRCGRSLLSKPPTKFHRLHSSTPTLAVAESATPLPRSNALTSIHKSSALLPSILSPMPKFPIESLKLWTDLLDYAHNASMIRKDSASNEGRKARIVGAFIPHLSSTSCAFSLQTPHLLYSTRSTSGFRSV